METPKNHEPKKKETGSTCVLFIFFWEAHLVFLILGNTLVLFTSEKHIYPSLCFTQKNNCVCHFLESIAQLCFTPKYCCAFPWSTSMLFFVFGSTVVLFHTVGFTQGKGKKISEDLGKPKQNLKTRKTAKNMQKNCPHAVRPARDTWQSWGTPAVPAGSPPQGVPVR